MGVGLRHCDGGGVFFVGRQGPQQGVIWESKTSAAPHDPNVRQAADSIGYRTNVNLKDISRKTLAISALLNIFLNGPSQIAHVTCSIHCAVAEDIDTGFWMTDCCVAAGDDGC